MTPLRRKLDDMTTAVIFNLALIAGVVLMAVLAVVPFLIEADLERPRQSDVFDEDVVPAPIALPLDALAAAHEANRLAA